MSDNKLVKEIPEVVGISKKKMGMALIIVTLVFGSLIFAIASYRSESIVDDNGADNPISKVTKSEQMSAEDAIEQLDSETRKRGSLSKSQIRHKKRVLTPIKKVDENNMIGAEGQNHIEDEKAMYAQKRREAVVEGFNSQISSTSIYGVENLNDTHSSNAQARQSQSSFDPMIKTSLDSLNKIPNEYGMQNGQSQKAAFLKKMKATDSSSYLDSSLKKSISPYEIKSGTIISANLITGINSDLPGNISASVSRNVYDSVTGNHLLIPQGSKLEGMYSSQISYGQDRVLFAWSRIIMPNGDSYDLQGQPGVDLSGMSGISDIVDNHTFKIFGSALAFSVFGALGQLSQPRQAANVQPSNSQIVFGAVGQEMTQTAAKLIERNMNIQPTNKIRPGAAFRVLLTKDMIFPGAYQFN